MNGFSLIEIIIVMALFGILLALSMPTTIDFYRSQAIVSERDTLVSLLRRARTLAIVNQNGAPHGLFIGSDKYVVFEGSSYASRATSEDESFPRESAVSVSGSDEIVFSALSGDSSSSTLVIRFEPRTVTISVNSEGAILWQ